MTINSRKGWFAYYRALYEKTERESAMVMALWMYLLDLAEDDDSLHARWLAFLGVPEPQVSEHLHQVKTL